MPCGKWKVNFTRKGKRLQTDISFHKKARAIMYAKALNKKIKNTRARVVKALEISGEEWF